MRRRVMTDEKAARLGAAQDQIVELIEEAARLHAAPDAPMGGSQAVIDLQHQIVELGAEIAGLQTEVRIPISRSADLACTLAGGAEAMDARVEDWRGVVGRATGREAIEGGVALRFDHDVALTTELARLAAAEYACCSFFAFTLDVNGEGLRFAVTGPAEAADAVTAVFGSAQ
jgi:hypothetical protein